MVRPDQRLSRRWWVVGLVAAFVAACGPSDEATEPTAGFPTTSPPATAAATTPPTTVPPALYGGEVRVSMCPLITDWYTESVNPLRSWVWGQHLRRATEAAVWQLDTATNEIVPGVVIELPSLDNGGLVVDEEGGTLEVRYDLDPDAVWSDGVPITGGDLAYTYEVFTDPALMCRFYDEPPARVEAYLEEHHSLSATSLQTDSSLAELGITNDEVITLVSEVTNGFELEAGLAAEVASLAELAEIVAAETRCLHLGPYDRTPPYDLIDPDTITWDSKSFSFTMTDLIPDWRLLFHMILPEHDVAGTDLINDWNTELWVSGGPFILEPVEDPSEVVLTRNDRFWKTDPATGMQLPYLDRVVEGPFMEGMLANTPEEHHDEVRSWQNCEGEPSPAIVDATAAAIRSGELEMATLTWPTPLVDSRKAIQAVVDDPAVGVSHSEYHRWDSLNFNFDAARGTVNLDSLNEHLEFRQAVAHAIDRARLGADIWALPAHPLDSYIQVVDPAGPPRGWAQYDHDPDKARALLATLCQRLGRDCAVDPPRMVLGIPEWGQLPVWAKMAERVADMLDDVGIVVEVRGLDDIFSEWDVLLAGWMPTDPGLIDLIYHHTLAVEGDDLSVNMINWGLEESLVRDEFSERYFELWDDMRKAVDDDHLWPLIAEAETILSDQMIYLPLIEEPGIVLWSASVEHLEPASHRDWLWDIAYWRRTDLGE